MLDFARFSRSERGMTIVELLVGLCFVGIMLGMLATSFMWGYRHVGKAQKTFDLSTSGLNLLRELTDGFVGPGHVRLDGLLASTAVTYEADVTGATLNYVVADGDDVTYRWDEHDGTLTRNINATESERILTDVEFFRICLDGSMLHVVIVQKTTGVPVSEAKSDTKVYLRNASASHIVVPTC